MGFEAPDDCIDNSELSAVMGSQRVVAMLWPMRPIKARLTMVLGCLPSASAQAG
jgi:hypothetical protein